MSAKRTTIGFDLGEHGLKCAVIQGNPPVVRHLWMDEVLPYRKSREEVPAREFLRERVSGLLRKYKGDCGEFHSRVVTAVQGKGTICRYVELPLLSNQEQALAIVSEAMKFTPYDPGDFTLSHVSVPSLNPDGKTKGVFLVIAQKKPVDGVKSLLESCGLEVERIEVPALALAREAYFNHRIPDGEFFALGHIGFRFFHLVLLRDGFPYFARDFELAGRDFTYAIQMSDRISWEDAEWIKTKSSSPGTEVCLEPFLERCSREVRRSIEHFKAQFSGNDFAINKLLISGGGSCLKDFDQYLSKAIGIPVEVEKWDRLDCDDGAINGRALAPFAVALGLALDTESSEVNHGRVGGFAARSH